MPEPKGPQGLKSPKGPKGPKRLSVPRRVSVQAAEDDGRPTKIDEREVDAVCESWLIEDRWWTERPLRRRYWELVSDAGRDIVVFHDLIDGRWYTQR